jgi:GST-like protein
MIDLYSWPTPNGHKIHIMLEECGLEYRVHPVNIGDGDQFKPDFLKISPNNKIPAMIDHDGPGGKDFPLAETGAMLVYLADKSGKFLPGADTDPTAHYAVMQWLFFQIAHVGPMLGQVHHFKNYAPQRVAVEKVQYGIDRFVNEANRLAGVMDRELSKKAYIAGDEYTIADMAIWPWIHNPSNEGIEIGKYPNVEKWIEKIRARPGVQRGMEVLKEHRRVPGRPYHNDKSWEILYGKTQIEGGPAQPAR